MLTAIHWCLTHAYYLSVLGNLPKIFEGIHIKIESEEFCDEENATLLFVSKSPNIAGFQNIIPNAKCDDGLLHVLMIRKSHFIETVQIFIDILRGIHIKRSAVRYFTTKKIRISQLDNKESRIGIDGEKGGIFPVQVEIVPQSMRLIVPRYSPM